MITTQNTHIRYTRQSPGWSQVVPGNSHSEPLTDLSMGQLLALLHSRKLSPVELVEAHIARIQAVNPMINALVVDRFAAARTEAKAAELRYASSGSADVLPPLLGVPCSIKDFVAVQGLPQTGGWSGAKPNWRRWMRR